VIMSAETGAASLWMLSCPTMLFLGLYDGSLEAAASATSLMSVVLTLSVSEVMVLSRSLLTGTVSSDTLLYLPGK